jgi:hypothetical protein
VKGKVLKWRRWELAMEDGRRVLRWPNGDGCGEVAWRLRSGGAAGGWLGKKEKGRRVGGCWRVGVGSWELLVGGDAGGELVAPERQRGVAGWSWSCGRRFAGGGEGGGWPAVAGDGMRAAG